MPASRNEYYSIKQQLEVESFPGEKPGDPPRSFHQLPKVEQARLERKRLAGKGGGEGRGEEGDHFALHLFRLLQEGLQEGQANTRRAQDHHNMPEGELLLCGHGMHLLGHVAHE